jgi:hypothetical protein
MEKVVTCQQAADLKIFTRFTPRSQEEFRPCFAMAARVAFSLQMPQSAFRAKSRCFGRSSFPPSKPALKRTRIDVSAENHRDD